MIAGSGNSVVAQVGTPYLSLFGPQGPQKVTTPPAASYPVSPAIPVAGHTAGCQALSDWNISAVDIPPLSGPVAMPLAASGMPSMVEGRVLTERLRDPSYRVTAQDEQMLVAVLEERKKLFPKRSRRLKKNIEELKSNLNKRSYSRDQREALLEKLHFPLSFAKPPCCEPEGLSPQQCEHLARVASLGCGCVFDKGQSLEYEADWACTIPEDLLIALFERSDRKEATRMASVLVDGVAGPLLHACLARFPEYVARLGRDVINELCGSDAAMSRMIFGAQVQAAARGSVLPASCLTGFTPCTAAALLYTCYNLGRLDDAALQQAMTSLGRKNEASYMAAAACLGLEPLYAFFEQRGTEPDYRIGFPSGNMLHYLDAFCPRDAAESSVANFAVRERLLRQAPPALFLEKNAQGCTPLTAWIQKCRRETTESTQTSSHMASRVRWSLLYCLLELTPGPVPISKTVASRAASHWDRELTSAQCRLLLDNRLNWSEKDRNKFPFLQALLPLLPADRRIDTKEAFVAFMDRLVSWKPATGDCPLREALPDWLEVLRPELRAGESTDAQAEEVEPFNTNGGEIRMLLEDVFSRTTWFQYKLIAGFLEQASDDKIAAITQHWLSDRASPDAIRWLFSQNLHPNNTLFREHVNCSVLLNGALRLARVPRADHSFPATGSAMAVNPMPEYSGIFFLVCTRPDQVIGRTLVWWDRGGRHHYIKLQDNTESDEQFKTGCARLDFLHSKSQDWNLISTIGQPQGLYRLNLEQLMLSESDWDTLEERVGGGETVLGLHFTLPLDAPYESYITDASLSAEEFAEGMNRYAHDAGTLWAKGINGPDCLSTFHDTKTRRSYHFLAEISPFINVGMLEDIQRVLQYPNVGPAGMRDQMDTWPCREATPDYFAPNNKSDRLLLILDPSDDRDINRARLMEAAKVAWGGLMLCGFRCQRMKEKNQPFDLEAILASFMETFFSKAFNLPPADCRALMATDDTGWGTLLSQMTRELRYWMDDVHGTCIRDSIHSIADPVTYPHLLARGVGVISQTDMQMEFLHESLEKRVYNLGVMRNGRNPILAGYALVIKLLTVGMLRSWQRDQAAGVAAAGTTPETSTPAGNRVAAMETRTGSPALVNGMEVNGVEVSGMEVNGMEVNGMEVNGVESGSDTEREAEEREVEVDGVVTANGVTANGVESGSDTEREAEEREVEAEVRTRARSRARGKPPRPAPSTGFEPVSKRTRSAIRDLV